MKNRTVRSNKNNSARDLSGEPSCVSIRYACSVLIPLCLFSAIVAGFTISAANDVYAFVKDSSELTLSIDEPISPEHLAKLLKSLNVIRHDRLFLLYLNSKGKTSSTDISGKWTLNQNMSYREILLEIF